MNGKEYINILKWLMSEMEPFVGHPDRNSYCCDFDEVYNLRKKKLMRLCNIGGVDYDTGIPKV